MMRRPLLTLVFFLSLAIGMAPVLHAQSVPPSERQKIEALIKYIGEMSETKYAQIVCFVLAPQRVKTESDNIHW